ncbi:MAG TPA: hypothetical protein VFS64_09385 [Solirubrobacterales bacterium]|nr:hypothetical protein [Solirubrobacterales bacterium]
MKSIRTIVTVAASALLATAFFAASAQACAYEKGEEVFSPWHDPRSYVLGPDGGFEAGGTGWSLEEGASVGAGNESAFLNGAGDTQSLSLPEGSSATSPVICFSRETPFFRAMATNGGEPGSRLRVDFVYPELDVTHTRTVGGSRDEWAPTQPLAASFGLATVAGTESVQLRLTAVSGDWQVDDVYVDPFARY